MSTLIPFLTLEQSCEQVQDWANKQLVSDGFHVVQTFDLQGARLAHPDCTCPNHGTDDCNCQMVVLLVYQHSGDPATLVIHGQEGKSWLSLAASGGHRTSRHLQTTIQRTLQPKPSKNSPRAEGAYENAKSTA